MILVWTLIFLIALVVLIYSSDKFTDAAGRIGLYLGMQPFLVGVTIVALGTSLPELTSSIIAMTKDSSAFVIGNVIGSNIANIFLILGLAAIIGAWKKPMLISFNIASVDLPILIGSGFLLGFALLNNTIDSIEASFFLLAYIIYMFYSMSKTKTIKNHHKIELVKEIPKQKSITKDVFILILSMIFIYLGAKYIVDAVLKISGILQIGTEIIALTAVAIGTSLPELSVSIIAAKKKNYELALGNVIGSNIFNILMILGVTGLMGNIIIPQTILTFHLPMMIAATLLCLFITQDKEITKWEGLFLVLFYVFYLVKIFA